MHPNKTILDLKKEIAKRLSGVNVPFHLLKKKKPNRGKDDALSMKELVYRAENDARELYSCKYTLLIDNSRCKDCLPRISCVAIVSDHGDIESSTKCATNIMSFEEETKEDNIGISPPLADDQGSVKSQPKKKNEYLVSNLELADRAMHRRH